MREALTSSNSVSEKIQTRRSRPYRAVWFLQPLQGKHLLAEEHRIPTVRTSDGYHTSDGANLLLTPDDHPSARASYDRLFAGDDRLFTGADSDCVSAEADYGHNDDIAVAHLSAKGTGDAVLDA